MITSGDPTQRFDGYSDHEETEKKILKDVFKRGDKYFRSGDLMKRDTAGHVYFVDRIGDTFRWKGENVSTTQVESTIRATDVKECTVYGVSLDKYEGKAGCALIKVESAETPPLDSIRKALQSNLPKEAWPVFLRFTEGDMPTTDTYKYQKQELANQFFDLTNLSREGEQMFVRIHDDNFVKLTSDIFREIQQGSARL